MTTLAQAMKEIALCEAMRFPQVRHVTHENYTQEDLAEANGDLPPYEETLRKAQALFPSKPFNPPPGDTF